jgi:hypothetical protein
MRKDQIEHRLSPNLCRPGMHRASQCFDTIADPIGRACSEFRTKSMFFQMML